jgi:hypothetical protein
MSTTLLGYCNTIPGAVILFYGTSLAGIEQVPRRKVWLSIVSASRSVVLENFCPIFASQSGSLGVVYCLY